MCLRVLNTTFVPGRFNNIFSKVPLSGVYRFILRVFVSDLFVLDGGNLKAGAHGDNFLRLIWRFPDIYIDLKKRISGLIQNFVTGLAHDQT